MFLHSKNKASQKGYKGECESIKTMLCFIALYCCDGLIQMATLQGHPMGKKFCRYRSISHGFRDISIFVFCNFCENFENSKWPPFLARQIVLENWNGYSTEIPHGSKISSKSLYLAQFSKYKHFCVLLFLRKIRKFKMSAIFGETKIF